MRASVDSLKQYAFVWTMQPNSSHCSFLLVRNVSDMDNPKRKACPKTFLQLNNCYKLSILHLWKIVSGSAPFLVKFSCSLH